MTEILKVLGRQIWQLESSVEYLTRKNEELQAEVDRLNGLLNGKPNTAEKWPKTVAEGLFDVMSKDWEREKGLTAAEGDAAYD